jgi:uncharacterized protein YceK
MGALCLKLLLLLPGCASVATHRVGPGFSGSTPQRYAHSLDSATNGCLRNPAACHAPPGEEAILPWLARALSALRTAAATLRLLEGAQVQHVEQVLFQCVKDAHLRVNDEELGTHPTEAQCKEVVRREGNTDITRAMDLGSKKHARALECFRTQMEVLFPDNGSIEPHHPRDQRQLYAELGGEEQPVLIHPIYGIQ